MGEKEIEVLLAKYEGRIKTLEREMNGIKTHKTAVYERLSELEKGRHIMEFQFKQIMDNIVKIKEEIKTLKEKPSKRLDLIITSIISIMIASVWTYLFNMFLNK